MRRIPGLARAAVAFLTLSVSSSAFAEKLQFVVTDNDNTPLSDVVIEPHSNASASGQSQPVAVIDQVDKRFQPQQILIQSGQSVDFPNSDNIRHHVYSFSKAKSFELKLYADTPENPVQFPTHGVVVLGCNIHDTMIGYIFVSSSEHSVVTDDSGEATLDTNNVVEKIRVWHKHQSAGPESLQTIDMKALNKDEQGRYIITMDTVEPEPTNSFEDTFRGISQAD